MALKLIYQLLAKLLSWMVLRVRSDTTKDLDAAGAALAGR